MKSKGLVNAKVHAVLTPKIDTATWAFLGLSDMRHGL